MLTQRLLNILRIFNDPKNASLVQNVELIPQDISFLRENGLKVEVIESNSTTSICSVSRDKKIEEGTEEKRL
jgi:hypothetical protein